MNMLSLVRARKASIGLLLCLALVYLTNLYLTFGYIGSSGGGLCVEAGYIFVGYVPISPQPIQGWKCSYSPTIAFPLMPFGGFLNLKVWYLAIPIPLALIGSAALVVSVGSAIRARRTVNACHQCGYSLDGLATTSDCPECGYSRSQGR